MIAAALFTACSSSPGAERHRRRTLTPRTTTTSAVPAGEPDDGMCPARTSATRPQRSFSYLGPAREPANRRRYPAGTLGASSSFTSAGFTRRTAGSVRGGLKRAGGVARSRPWAASAVNLRPAPRAAEVRGGTWDHTPHLRCFRPHHRVPRVQNRRSSPVAITSRTATAPAAVPAPAAASSRRSSPRCPSRRTSATRRTVERSGPSRSRPARSGPA